MRRPSAGHAPLLWLVLYLLFLHTPLASAKCELTTAGRCGQGGGGWWWGGPRTSLWEFLPPCLIDAGRSVAPRRGLAATHAPAARAGPCETAGPFDRPTAAADGRLPVVCRPLVGSITDRLVRLWGGVSRDLHIAAPVDKRGGGDPRLANGVGGVAFAHQSSCFIGWLGGLLSAARKAVRGGRSLAGLLRCAMTAAALGCRMRHVRCKRGFGLKGRLERCTGHRCPGSPIAAAK